MHPIYGISFQISTPVTLVNQQFDPETHHVLVETHLSSRYVFRSTVDISWYHPSYLEVSRCNSEISGKCSVLSHGPRCVAADARPARPSRARTTAPWRISWTRTSTSGGAMLRGSALGALKVWKTVGESMGNYGKRGGKSRKIVEELEGFAYLLRLNWTLHYLPYGIDKGKLTHLLQKKMWPQHA